MKSIKNKNESDDLERLEKTVEEFLLFLLTQSKDIDPDFVKIVEENFDDLLA